MFKINGFEMHALAQRLWGINRSITGAGVRETLSILREINPEMNVVEVPTGTKVFDWVIPKEWVVREAYILTPDGRKICDFQKNNLHLVGYSKRTNISISLEDLQNHLHSLADQPEAIPYVTSYYSETWGFCLSDNERKTLTDGFYQIHIDADHFNGSLSYGEILLKGKSSREILLSTYVCHPSMANNELSGPVVITYLVSWLKSQPSLNYSYRILFIPETIGSIAYLSKNLNYLKKNVVAGFNVSCVGDDRAYSYLPTRKNNTISDDVAKHVLKNIDPLYVNYHWWDRGSDERQYCAPGVDLPIASIMRTKYGEYPEYHTSLDNLIDVVTPAGLLGGFNAIMRSLEALENNCFPRVKVLCEPYLSSRGLYPTLSFKGSVPNVKLMMNFISCCDGEKSLLEIAEMCSTPIWNLYPLLDELIRHDLIEINNIN